VSQTGDDSIFFTGIAVVSLIVLPAWRIYSPVHASRRLIRTVAAVVAPWWSIIIVVAENYRDVKLSTYPYSHSAARAHCDSCNHDTKTRDNIVVVMGVGTVGGGVGSILSQTTLCIAYQQQLKVEGGDGDGRDGGGTLDIATTLIFNESIDL